MSFILDAIAKSEQERQQQEMPRAEVLAIPAAQAPPPRRFLTYLVVVVLLLNAAALALWLRSNQTLADWLMPAQQENADRRDEAARLSTDSSSGNLNRSSGVAPDSTGSEAIARSDDAGSVDEMIVERHSVAPARADESVANLVAEPASVPTESAAALARDGENDNALAGRRETAPAESAAAANVEDTSAWLRIEPDTLSSKMQPDRQGGAAQDPQNKPALWHRVSRISELPGDVRKDLPTVVFSGHLYSSNKKASIVFVDANRPVMQGQQIVDEVFLHEITPTGVIVEFRGYLIDVGVLQNWTLN